MKNKRNSSCKSLMVNPKLKYEFDLSVYWEDKSIRIIHYIGSGLRLVRKYNDLVDFMHKNKTVDYVEISNIIKLI